MLEDLEGGQEVLRRINRKRAGALESVSDQLCQPKKDRDAHVQERVRELSAEAGARAADAERRAVEAEARLAEFTAE